MKGKIIGRIDGFARTTCPRCHTESLGVCTQCISIATMIVESCAMNLAAMPVEAFEDAATYESVVSAVKAARKAFYDSGISAETIQKLLDKLRTDIVHDLTTLEASKEQTNIITPGN